MKQSLSIESESQQARHSAVSANSVLGVQAFADNRESTAAQRQLKIAMANFPQAAAQRRTSQLMNNNPRLLVQRKMLSGEPVQCIEEDESLQKESGPIQRVEEEELQKKAATDSPAQLEQQSSAKPNNTGLPDNLKSGIENLSGMSMDSVRVHYNSSQPAQLNALAYAQGTDIHVAPGQEQHLPHEVRPVMQQEQERVNPATQMKGVVQRDEDRDKSYAKIGAMSTLGLLGGAALLGGALPTLGLLAGGAIVGGAIGWGASRLRESFLPEGPSTSLAPVEDSFEYGHDEEEGLGEQESNLKAATRDDVKPELYGEIEELTTMFGNLSLNESGKSTQYMSANRYNTQQFKLMPGATVFQLARGSGPSYQEYYKSNSHGDYKKVEYNRNTLGTFDFAKRPMVYKGGRWENPVKNGSKVDLEQGAKKKGYGITSGKKLAEISKASRAVHFSIANRIMKNGAGQSSPDGWTWHHLPEEYKMVLVDRQVHRKHGHNGGKFLWK
ncbi:HNH endonuclease [Nitrosomonas sp. Is24]|uniref:HNH endonuclease signature motif containing protein n=1 Tax=Nitrosomonas sp. Is24 TaxID=3080533 RepID=UPI00294B0A48|nr:HNH endonuclease [Nitrosomonas sp. Is24]MDV6342330.1 HNH endonuclease [Nitrosomonas sp. Is24]